MKNAGFSVLVAALMVLFALPLSAQNPVMIEDLNPGSVSAFPGTGVTIWRDALNGKVFISGDDGASGQEIMMTAPPFDAGSTGLLKDMTPGTGGSSAYYYAAYDKLFFVSPTTLGYIQGLCRSDGTTNGTSLLFAPPVKTNIAAYIRDIQASQGKIFFSGYTTRIGNPVMDFTGFLYVTDPVTGASIKLKSGGNYQSMTSVNGKFVCFEWNWPYDSKALCRLWSSNGTAKGTVAYYNLPLDEISTDYPMSPHPYGNHKTFCVGGNNLFFQFNDAAHGSEIWKTDGTAAGTMRVTDINPGAAHASPAMGAVMGEYLYFSAKDGVNGYQIWRYPVSGNGAAERVTDIPGGAADPMWITPLNGWLYFSAYTPATGRELWKSNGLPLGGGALTSLVADINPIDASSNPNYAVMTVGVLPYRFSIDEGSRTYKFTMAVMGGHLYFGADDGGGYALWRSDGSNVEKLGGAYPRKLTPVSWVENDVPKSMLIFVGWSDAYGYELWKFDPALAPSPKRGDNDGSPAGFALSQNYPNPFNPSTVIRYEIKQPGHVRLSVYDMYGRKVAALVDGERPSGPSSAVFNADALPSGMYTYVLESGGAALSRVMTLVK